MTPLSRLTVSAMIFAVAMPFAGSAYAIKNCPSGGEGVEMKVRRSATATWDKGTCRLKPGRRVHVNAACGCKDGRGSCSIYFYHNDHVYEGTFREIVSGKCIMWRHRKCKPYKKGECGVGG